MDDPAKKAVEADLNSPRFRLGVARGWWRIILFDFPRLIVSVAATKADGSKTEYAFRFELTGFPGADPEAQIWDPVKNVVLPVSERPDDNERVRNAFKHWSADTVYRPWERHAAAHNHWRQTYSSLLWNSKRELAYAMEDLYELLNLHA